jgi:hypothetical protein
LEIINPDTTNLALIHSTIQQMFIQEIFRGRDQITEVLLHTQNASIITDFTNAYEFPVNVNMLQRYNEVLSDRFIAQRNFLMSENADRLLNTYNDGNYLFLENLIESFISDPTIMFRNIIPSNEQADSDSEEYGEKRQ